MEKTAKLKGLCCEWMEKKRNFSKMPFVVETWLERSVLLTSGTW